MRAALLIAAAYLVMSVATFLAFAFDKRAARRGRPRTPERVLHTLELLAGWPGALAAQRLLHHKSRKPSYRLVLAAIITLHLLAWALLAWLLLN
ncbi:MAG: DUF1294 domain-containing protein [Phycisphaerales bacterium]